MIRCCQSPRWRLALALLVIILFAFSWAVDARDVAPDPEEQASAAIADLGERLKSALMQKMQADGPVAAVDFCHVEAPIIAAEVAAEHGVRVGRTALRLRSLGNVANSWQQEVLEDFQQKARTTPPQEMAFTARTADSLRVARGIPVQAPCLVCHGSAIAEPVREAIHERLTMSLWHRSLQAAAAAASLCFSITVFGQGVPSGFDAHVLEVMRAHDVPGMAISVVKDGNIVHAQGYGVRQLGGEEPVDADTIFPTGSTGKAVTAAALAILVDDGKLDWDDRVIDHMPDFRMYDAWVTREMTVRDLLVHRSGLGLGAGDLLMIPRTTRSRTDIVRALRHIKPATSFRSAYAYDNILYVVAGELVTVVSGQSWETFVRDRIFKPLGMKTAVSDENDRFATSNRVQPHARLDPRLRGLGEQQMLPEREGLGQVGAPAGGLSWSAKDFSLWMQAQLAQGAAPDGSRVWSEASAREMWTPQVPMAIHAYPEPITDITPQFSSYALGWNVQDYRGTKVVQHGGAVFGVLAFVVMVPEHDLGIALQINSEDAGVLRALGYELLDHYLGLPPRDWMAAFDTWNEERLAGGLALLDSIGKTAARKKSKASLPLADYAGNYADAWYGPISLDVQGGKLRIDFKQTPNMAGTLRHWQYDTFVVDWDDSSIEPAYASFSLDAEGGVAQITMKAVSPLADFSYNYHDLRFVPVGDKAGE